MMRLASTRDVLLRRQGLMFVEPGGVAADERVLQALDMHLADLGYAVSTRLRAALAAAGVETLDDVRAATAAALGKPIAAGQRHQPLFRKFPDDIPDDTFALWLDRVLVHFCQAEGQPCLFCRRVGTTHVLSPCHHVVCDRCFDGASYSACPVCNRHVDPSPFFQPAPADSQRPPREQVRFKLLDLGAELLAAARELFLTFCARPQAMSPTDRADFTTIVRELGAVVIPWIPERIPVKENVALVLGTLFQQLPADVVLPVARRLFATATDVLRFVAVWSGADASLQAEKRLTPITASQLARWHGKAADNARKVLDSTKRYGWGTPQLGIASRRFRIARMPRPVRRALLAVLDGLPADSLFEDMLRHRSRWVWVGELLHPHDYAGRFPTAARGFAIVRGRAPDGTPAPRFRTFAARVDVTVRARDARAMVALLRARPGELGRRYDHALRLAGDDPAALAVTVDALVAAAGSMSTPLLLTLATILPTRLRPAPIRMYWPKGQLAVGASGPDRRAVLRNDAIAPSVRALEGELLRRCAAHGPLADVVIDAMTRSLVVPFNERTASRAAVALTRGSRLGIPGSKALRLFLHWCEPKGGQRTDVDLSVAFYDEGWHYRGVCSYYELTTHDHLGAVVARSSGDLTSAPFPDGASEFVDVDRRAARQAGFRYAVMVVNNYSGMPFAALERATAGVMLRADLGGTAFDPRTVELAFDLQGDNGVYLPLIVDLEDDTLHWVDVYARGGSAFNNVATSNQDLRRLGSQLLTYFGSRVRPTMYALALFHAAARAQRVLVREHGDEVHHPSAPTPTHVFTRAAGESALHFLDRLQAGAADARLAHLPPLTAPVLAVLLRGDVELPAGSTAYALFRERLTSTIAAADLLA